MSLYKFIRNHAAGSDWKKAALDADVDLPEAKAYLDSAAGKAALELARADLEVTNPEEAAANRFERLRGEILQRANARLSEILAKESDDIHEVMLGATEAQAFKKLLGENPSESMIQWYLRTKHKAAGYNEKIEVDNTHTIKTDIDPMELAKRFAFITEAAKRASEKKVIDITPKTVSEAE